MNGSDGDRFAPVLQNDILGDGHPGRDQGIEGFLQPQAAFEESPEAGRNGLTHF